MKQEITYEDFQKAMKIVNDYKSKLETHFKEIKKEMSSISKFANVTSETKFLDTYTSVRLLNIIKCHDDEIGIENFYEMKVGDLSKISITECLKWRLMGKKSLTELKELCFYAGVALLP